MDLSQDLTLYVEGLQLSTARAAESIELQRTVVGQIVTDTIKLTVYEITGATEVPDHSVYTYRAEVPGGAPNNWGVAGGSILHSYVADGTSSESWVKWGGGPVVGKVIFQPADGFRIERETNVVHIDVRRPPQGNVFTGTIGVGGLVETGTTHAHPNGITVIRAGGVSPFNAYARVTMSGPNGGRGISEMIVGFVQTVKLYESSAVYGDADLQLVSNLEGEGPFLDYGDDVPGPFTDETDSFHVWRDFTIDEPSRDLHLLDSPSTVAPLTFDKGIDRTPTDVMVKSFHARRTMQLDICVVSSSEPVIEPETFSTHTLTRRATADWALDFSQVVTYGGDGEVSLDYVRDSQGFPRPAGIFVPDDWTTVTNASSPQWSDERSFNDIGRTEDWELNP